MRCTLLGIVLDLPKHVLRDVDYRGKHLHAVKPVLSGHRIKRTPSIKRTVVEVPKFISLVYFK